VTIRLAITYSPPPLGDLHPLDWKVVSLPGFILLTLHTYFR